MTGNSVYAQLGKFVVLFQHLERSLTDLIVIMAKADDEIIRILIAELSYLSRVKATDVAFARIVDLLRDPKPENVQEQFHSLMVKCQKIGELRNDLVHSRYADLLDNNEVIALVRENPKLRGKEGVLRVEGEDLSSECLEQHFIEIHGILEELEKFRLMVIDWKYCSS